jgi:hypothetical protein
MTTSSNEAEATSLVTVATIRESHVIHNAFPPYPGNSKVVVMTGRKVTFCRMVIAAVAMPGNTVF